MDLQVSEKVLVWNTGKSKDLFAGGCRNTGRGRNPAKHCVEGSSSEQELDEPQCATDSGSEFGEEELCSGWQHVGAAIAESENLAAGLFGAEVTKPIGAATF